MNLQNRNGLLDLWHFQKKIEALLKHFPTYPQYRKMHHERRIFQNLKGSDLLFEYQRRPSYAKASYNVL